MSPEFEGQGQRSRSPGTKKTKTAESSPLTMHSRACAVARPYTARNALHAATDDTIACRPGLTGYTGGKISACALVFPSIRVTGISEREQQSGLNFNCAICQVMAEES